MLTNKSNIDCWLLRTKKIYSYFYVLFFSVSVMLSQNTRLNKRLLHISFRSQMQLFHYLLNEYWLCLLNLNATIFTDQIKTANPRNNICMHLPARVYLFDAHLTLNHWIWIQALEQFNSGIYFSLGMIKVVLWTNLCILCISGLRNLNRIFVVKSLPQYQFNDVFFWW